MANDNADVAVYPIEVDALNVGSGDASLAYLVGTVIVAVIGPTEVPLALANGAVDDTEQNGTNEKSANYKSGIFEDVFVFDIH